jgi:tRNA 2-thiouridine synthesizing protein A
MIEVDVWGLSCPIPAVKTKQAIGGNPNVAVAALVETEVSKENVSRLAWSKGYSVEIEKLADEYRLVLQPGSAAAAREA